MGLDYEYTYSENCILKDVCPRQKKIGCDSGCTIQPEFMYLYETSNIPKDMLQKTVLYPAKRDNDAFCTLKDIQMDIDNFVNDGRILYLWSTNSGCSKTTWACKLMKTYLAVVCIGNGFKDRARFVYVPSLLLLAKEFQNESREETLDMLNKLDLVVIDDIGAVQNSNYDITILSNIIDTRYRNGLATIFTSNLSPQELERVIGVRLKDRVCSDVVIELKGGSHRRGTNVYKRRGAE